MPFDYPNDAWAGSCRRGEERPATSRSVKNVVTGTRHENALEDESQNTAMDVAVAKFAHEFANELHVVSGAIQLLEDQIEQPNEARDTLGHIKSGIQRVASLLSELRSLAQARRLSLQPTQLAAVIKELMAIEEPRCAANGIGVEVDLPFDLPPILLDAPKFRQALVNLCRNAVDAMPHGGSLTLRAYRTHSKVNLELIDTGEGIAPDLDVFALFTTTKPTGMGVGLSIVREIIAAHGGTVRYASKLGSGTIFRLTLPVRE
jgi:signal transduction histidine kinase